MQNIAHSIARNSPEVHLIVLLIDERQEQAGACVLDVNVGLPGIDEPKVMKHVIKLLQEVIQLPLQIDSSNFQAIEEACRYYNGKPLINSVNGKDETMEAVFPVVKKIWWCCHWSSLR